MQAMRLACALLAEAEILLMYCHTATAYNRRLYRGCYTDNTQSSMAAVKHGCSWLNMRRNDNTQKTALLTSDKAGYSTP